MLYIFLQRFTDRYRIFIVTIIVLAVQAIQRRFNIRFVGIAQCVLFGDRFLQMQICRAIKDYQVQQRVVVQTVSVVYRYISDFINGKQFRNNYIFVFFIYSQCLIGNFGRNIVYYVVIGWDNRNRFFYRIDVSEGTGKFQDIRQTGFENFFIQVIEFQFRVWFLRIIIVAIFTDFDYDGTRNYVTVRQVFGVRRITFYKTFVMFVQQIIVFITVIFGDQYVRIGNVGRVELLYFYILYRYVGTDSYVDIVVGVNVGVGGGLINTFCFVSRQYGSAGFEINYFIGFDVQCGIIYYRVILVFYQIQRILFGENGGVVFQVLLIKRV